MQIKVHGTTVIASFKQEVERSDKHMRDLISHLNGEEIISTGDFPDSNGNIDVNNVTQLNEEFLEINMDGTSSSSSLAENISVVGEKEKEGSDVGEILNIDTNINANVDINEDTLAMSNSALVQHVAEMGIEKEKGININDDKTVLEPVSSVEGETKSVSVDSFSTEILRDGTGLVLTSDSNDLLGNNSTAIVMKTETIMDETLLELTPTSTSTSVLASVIGGSEDVREVMKEGEGAENAESGSGSGASVTPTSLITTSTSNSVLNSLDLSPPSNTENNLDIVIEREKDGDNNSEKKENEREKENEGDVISALQEGEVNEKDKDYVTDSSESEHGEEESKEKEIEQPTEISSSISSEKEKKKDEEKEKEKEKEKEELVDTATDNSNSHPDMIANREDGNVNVTDDLKSQTMIMDPLINIENKEIVSVSTDSGSSLIGEVDVDIAISADQNKGEKEKEKDQIDSSSSSSSSSSSTVLPFLEHVSSPFGIPFIKKITDLITDFTEIDKKDKDKELKSTVTVTVEGNTDINSNTRVSTDAFVPPVINTLSTSTSSHVTAEKEKELNSNLISPESNIVKDQSDSNNNKDKVKERDTALETVVTTDENNSGSGSGSDSTTDTDANTDIEKLNSNINSNSLHNLDTNTATVTVAPTITSSPSAITVDQSSHCEGLSCTVSTSTGVVRDAAQPSSSLSSSPSVSITTATATLSSTGTGTQLSSLPSPPPTSISTSTSGTSTSTSTESDLSGSAVGERESNSNCIVCDTAESTSTSTGTSTGDVLTETEEGTQSIDVTSILPSTSSSSSSPITSSHSVPTAVLSSLPSDLTSLSQSQSLPIATATATSPITTVPVITTATTTGTTTANLSEGSVPIPLPQGVGVGNVSHSVRLINGPTAGLSPLCLETLRFSEFQAQMAKKMKQKADLDKTQVPQNSQDNVFRQLMLKIKTLEMNYAIIEMYSAQVNFILFILLMLFFHIFNGMKLFYFDDTHFYFYFYFIFTYFSIIFNFNV